MHPIMTCLWFDKEAEEAANFYVSVFPDSKIKGLSRYAEGGPGAPGSVMTVAFSLNGRDFLGLNGGPIFKFSEAISLIIRCESQAELDSYWDKLLEGGSAQQCGWLKDRYGLSWQIVPDRIGEWMSGANPEGGKRVMGAIMGMVKIDLAACEAAYAGRE